MCKHIYNTQVYILAPCCGHWYECAECHDEVEKHTMKFSSIMRFTCKNCRKCFSRDFHVFSNEDKECPYCGTVWCLPAVTPESLIFQDCQQIMDHGLSTILNVKDPYFAPK